MSEENNPNSVMTEEDVEKAKLDKVEESALQIKALAGTFRQMGYSLSNRKKRAVVRVLEAVLFEPLEDVQLMGKAEKDLLAICNQIMYHKNKLAAYAVERKLEQDKGE